MIERKKIEWMMHSKTSSFKTAVEDARMISSTAVSKARFCIAWSGGKDSTAMTHLVKSMLPETKIVVQFDDCDWPEKRPYIERVSEKHGWEIHEVMPDFSVWEEMKKGGIGKEEFCSKSHAITKKSFLEPLLKKRIEIGCDGYFIGLRNEESRYRKLNCSMRGTVYATKDGEWRALPLSRWKTRDVFAYLVSNGIEINPCYTNDALRDPETIRLSWAVPTPKGMGHGDMENFRRNNPKRFAQLRDIVE